MAPLCLYTRLHCTLYLTHNWYLSHTVLRCSVLLSHTYTAYTPLIHRCHIHQYISFIYSRCALPLAPCPATAPCHHARAAPIQVQPCKSYGMCPRTDPHNANSNMSKAVNGYGYNSFYWHLMGEESPPSPHGHNWVTGFMCAAKVPSQPALIHGTTPLIGTFHHTVHHTTPIRVYSIHSAIQGNLPFIALSALSTNCSLRSALCALRGRARQVREEASGQRDDNSNGASPRSSLSVVRV